MNPLIKDIGMADPHARVFNDKVYLYTGNDADREAPVHFMKDWSIFSSTDLVEWKKEGTISSADNYIGADSPDCWAADATERNDKFYFYFSDRVRGIGVMSAPTPIGPFTDSLGEALVAPMHDPTILQDDDANKTPYGLRLNNSGKIKGEKHA